MAAMWLRDARNWWKTGRASGARPAAPSWVLVTRFPAPVPETVESCCAASGRARISAAWGNFEGSVLGCINQSRNQSQILENEPLKI